jgi:hypothetical protein
MASNEEILRQLGNETKLWSPSKKEEASPTDVLANKVVRVYCVCTEYGPASWLGAPIGWMIGGWDIALTRITFSLYSLFFQVMLYFSAHWCGRKFLLCFHSRRFAFRFLILLVYARVPLFIVPLLCHSLPKFYASLEGPLPKA